MFVKDGRRGWFVRREEGRLFEAAGNDTRFHFTGKSRSFTGPSATSKIGWSQTGCSEPAASTFSILTGWRT